VTESFKKIPVDLVEAALIDGPTAAAVGSQSISAFLQDVRDGVAPQPVIRQSRFARWRLTDIREYWIRRANEGSSATTRQAVVERGHRAYAATRRARKARTGCERP
jgi:hypothetical protein